MGAAHGGDLLPRPRAVFGRPQARQGVLTIRPALTVVAIAQRPDLAPVAAGWLWAEYGQRYGYTADQMRAKVAAATAPSGPPQTFVLLRDGQPIATASLAAEDLEQRPDLTPWLAGAYVVPDARGQGHVAHVIRAVEAAARNAGIGTLWLYTRRAEPVYVRAGWRTVEYFERNAKRYALMRRDLAIETRDR